MRVGINGWRIHGSTGVPRYVAGLVGHCTPERIPPEIERLTLYTPRPIDRLRTPAPPNVVEQVLAPDHRMLIWENLQLGPHCRDDVLLCPSNTRPLWTRSRVVVTTHDALPAMSPEWFARRARWVDAPWYGWCARHAELVLTVSQAAADDIHRAWGVPRERLRVIYLAARDLFRQAPSATERQTALNACGVGAAPFFLFVGKMTGRRDMPLLLDAFAEFRQRGNFPHRLVLVGEAAPHLKIQERIAEAGLSPCVHLPGVVSDDVLNVFYHAATALISPARYETMSLPVLEAQAAGTPVICLDAPALHEITGGAACMMERPERRLLAEAMERLARDSSLQAELSERGRAQSERFTWDRTARETLAALVEVGRGAV